MVVLVIRLQPVDGALMKGLTEVGLASSGAEGDTKFANVMNIVDVAMQNGSGDLRSCLWFWRYYWYTDSEHRSFKRCCRHTERSRGVENLNISSGLVKSTLTALTAATYANSMTVTGSTDLKITGASGLR